MRESIYSLKMTHTTWLPTMNNVAAAQVDKAEGESALSAGYACRQDAWALDEQIAEVAADLGSEMLSDRALKAGVKNRGGVCVIVSIVRDETGTYHTR